MIESYGEKKTKGGKEKVAKNAVGIGVGCLKIAALKEMLLSEVAQGQWRKQMAVHRKSN